MKKLIIFSTAALLFSGVSFAQEKEKGKEKPKKEKTDTKTSCPGKECKKKKA